jgi:hypothetical protein
MATKVPFLPNEPSLRIVVFPATAERPFDVVISAEIDVGLEGQQPCRPGMGDIVDELKPKPNEPRP